MNALRFVGATAVTLVFAGIIFLIVLGLTIYALLRGWWDAVGWLMLFNLIFKAYPVMLQRYNRRRLVRIMQRMNRRSKGAI